MLLQKGFDVHFVDENQRRIYLPTSTAMLHSPNGDTWARNSILFAPFTRSGTPVEMDADQRDYLGRGYDAHLGYVNLPPRSLSRWEDLGLVRTVFYERSGQRATGFFKHRFQAPGAVKSAVAGAVVGGLAGLLVGALANSSKPVIAGLLVGAVGGVIVGKAEFPVDPPARLYGFGNRYWRLELPRISLANWRGIVVP